MAGADECINRNSEVKMRIKAEDYYAKRSAEYFGNYLPSHLLSRDDKVKCLMHRKNIINLLYQLFFLIKN